MEINKRAPNRKDTGGLLCQMLLYLKIQHYLMSPAKLWSIS
jgi:hypothetical protein